MRLKPAKSGQLWWFIALKFSRMMKLEEKTGHA